MASKPLRRALGRGLTNLIPQDTEERGSANEVVTVDALVVESNPFQPRKDFPADEISGLAESIKSQGLLQPILLRKRTTGYQIISGERRFRALRLLGRSEIPAIVKANITDRDMMEMALVENIQREELDEIETAQAYQRLLQECGLSHEELSGRVGKSRSAITNGLRLLKLPTDIQDLLHTGALSAGHARALLAVEGAEKQREMAARIVAEKLTVRDIEHLGQAAKPAGASGKPRSRTAPAAAEGDPDLRASLDRARYRFGSKVEIVAGKGDHGHVQIAYFSTTDLNRIVALLAAQ